MQLASIRSLLRWIPVTVGTTGRARDVLLDAGDRLSGPEARAGLVEVEVAGRRLSADLAHYNERLLAYLGDKLFASFRRSPLGRYLVKVASAAGADGPGRFVDIGANLGFYALLAREHGMGTWLFEPEPRHVAWLERNAGALGRVFAIALSDAAGAAELFVASADNAGASSLVGQGSTYTSSVSVPLERFDALAARELAADERVSLIKIDVEGAEEAVVRGMTGFLAERRPPVWCEVRGPKSTRKADTCVEVARTFEAFGYRAYEPRGRGFRPFSPRADLRVFDLLFTTTAP